MVKALCDTIDIVFLEDLSGSFANDLPILKAQIPNLIASVEGLVPNTDFGVASFIDKPIGPFGASTDYVYQTHLAISADNVSVTSAINAMATRSGVDYPEAQLEGLLQTALRVAEVGWRTGAMRIVMLSTDAAYHVAGDFASAGPNNLDAVLNGSPPGTGEDYPTIAALRDALTAAAIFPVFSVTADVAGIYQDLVAQLGFGAVVTLTSNSTNFSDAVRTAMAAACGAITQSGTDGSDTIDGTSGDDGIYGGLGNDTIDGLAGEDVLDGGADDDTVHGGADNDDLRGGSGRDHLYGDDGDDVLRGGQGDDTMTGGTGADRYVVSLDDGNDIVTDFEDGLDRLDLSSVAIDIAAAAILSATAVAGGVKIVLPGATVTLMGLTLAQFDLTDVVLIDGNAAPKAVGDSASTSGTAPVIIDVLANDTDLEGAALSVVSVGTPGHGAAVINANGTITYTAAAGFAGVDTFTYGITDGSAAATATVSVTVAPVLIGGAGADILTGTAAADLMDGKAGDDTIYGLGGADTILGGAENDWIDGGAGADTISGGAGNDWIDGGASGAGELSENDVLNGDGGNDTLWGRAGSDQLFGGANDDELHGGTEDDKLDGGTGADALFGDGGSDELIGGAGDDVLDGGEGDDQFDGGDGHDTFVMSLTGVKDIWDEGDSPESSIDHIYFTGGLSFADITLSDNGSDLFINAGALSITVHQHFDAPEKQIEFLDFEDGTSYDLIADVLLDPIAVDDAATTAEDTAIIIDVLGNDDSATAALLGVLSAQYGTVVANLDGTVTYTPDANFFGYDWFTYRMTDGTGRVGTAYVDVEVTAVNDAPVAVDDAAAVLATGSVTGNVISGAPGADTDIDYDPLHLTEVRDASGAVVPFGVATALSGGGTLLIAATGAFTFDPAGEYDTLAKGTATTQAFSYTVADTGGLTDIGDVAITISALPNRAPVATLDTASVLAEGVVLIDALANDTDLDFDTLSLVSVGAAAGGVAELFNGAIRYTAGAATSGLDSFTYVVTDGDGGTATGTVRVTVNGAPVAGDDAFDVTDAAAISGDVIVGGGLTGADIDPEGAALTVTAAYDAGDAAIALGASTALAGGGLITIGATGAISFDPNGDFAYLAAGETATQTIRYTVSDGALTDDALASFTVTGSNDASVFTSAAAFSIAEGKLAVGTVTAQDADLSDTLVFAVDAGGDGALFDIDISTGALTFRAAPDHETPADIGGDNVYDLTVSVFDGTATVQQAIAITVTDVIEGGASGEVLRGGTGDDVIRSGGGPLDQAYGGIGADTFVFENIAGARDIFRIRDFTFGVDHLDLNGETVALVSQSARSTMVLLEGLDHDVIIVDGVGFGHDLFA